MFTGDLLLELSRALQIKDGARLEVVKDKGLPLKKELFGRERVEAKDREAWLGEGRGIVGRRVGGQPAASCLDRKEGIYVHSARSEGSLSDGPK